MATYHGIIKAICVNCGKITTDESALEILNDSDATCGECGIHAVAWHTEEEVIITTDEIRQVVIKNY
jgi:predicted  nucleic acid-binding Zn-ribbon protein